VEAPILLGSAITSSAACLPGCLSLCFFLLITVWVTPENQLAKLALRGSSVLPQDFRGPQMGFAFRWAGVAQFLCIIQLQHSLSRRPPTCQGGYRKFYILLMGVVAARKIRRVASLRECNSVLVGQWQAQCARECAWVDSANTLIGSCIGLDLLGGASFTAVVQSTDLANAYHWSPLRPLDWPRLR
jgi:hypothetical protein